VFVDAVRPDLLILALSPASSRSERLASPPASPPPMAVATWPFCPPSAPARGYAVGAGPGVRRRLPLSQSGVIAGLGTALGLLAGLGTSTSVLFAYNQALMYQWPGESAYPIALPWYALAVVLVVPLLSMLATGLLTRLTPAHRTPPRRLTQHAPPLPRPSVTCRRAVRIERAWRGRLDLYDHAVAQTAGRGHDDVLAKRALSAAAASWWTRGYRRFTPSCGVDLADIADRRGADRGRVAGGGAAAGRRDADQVQPDDLPGRTGERKACDRWAAGRVQTRAGVNSLVSRDRICPG
jgi:hypothetical protein